MDTATRFTIPGMIRTGTTVAGPCHSATAGAADGTTMAAEDTTIIGTVLTDGHRTTVMDTDTGMVTRLSL